jgi:hypothetical protein
MRVRVGRGARIGFNGPMRRRPWLPLAVASLGLIASACGDRSDAAPPASRGTVSGVGVLPDALSHTDTLAATDSTTTTTRPPRTTVAREPGEVGPVGERVEGNRLLMIGDSILASTSRRYTGEMCLGLVPLHWAVEIDAETSRFIEFGQRVLDERLNQGVEWDAAAVFLGTNFNGDLENYRRRLDDILERLAPRPTLLYTITEFQPNRREVNEVIRDMLAFYPNVQVVDWAQITADDPGLLSGDGYHLSTRGISRLVIETAAALGEAPTGAGGECLSSRFNDDSAGRIPGLEPRGPATTAPRRTGGGTGGGQPTTSAAPVVTTGAPATSAPASSSSTPGSSSPVSSSPTTPAPSTPTTQATVPPVTTPATTQPPATQPPPVEGGG